MYRVQIQHDGEKTVEGEYRSELVARSLVDGLVEAIVQKGHTACVVNLDTGEILYEREGTNLVPGAGLRGGQPGGRCTPPGRDPRRRTFS